MKLRASANSFGLSTIMNVAAECEIITSSPGSCIVDMECNNDYFVNYNIYELSRDYDRINCPPLLTNLVSNPAGVYVKYKNMQTLFDPNSRPDIIPQFQDDSQRYFIIELDLGTQEYSTTPIIENLPYLKTLKLDGNSLVEANLYNLNDLPSLRELDLSHNMINSFDIQRDRYLYNQLTILNVSNNYLVNIADATFDFLDSLEKLDLSHNYIDSLGVMTFEGIKHLKFLDLSSNRIPELKISLMRFNELEELYLDNNKIRKLVVEDFNRMPNIKKLSIKYNFITSINKNVFSKMLHLSKLDLSHNDVDVIDRDSFMGLIELKHIDLCDNKIKTIPPYIFQGKKVQFFGIVGNALEGHLLRGTFEGLNLMTELDLSYQHLTEVEDYGLYGLDAVTSVLLNDNDLIIVSNMSFVSLHKLERLDLSNNKITRVNLEIKDLVKLGYLSLKNNSISYIEKTDFRELTALHFLDLSLNNISHINFESFKTLNRLTDLDLSNNPLIGPLEGLTFSGLSLIPKLDISHTFLTVIKNEAFKGMRDLRELSLSFGQINEIEFNSFVGLTVIEIINLSFNNINAFMINTSELVNLNTLYLNNNKLMHISSHAFGGLVGLNKLVMANNSIKNIANDAFGDHSDLRYLDISFNTNLTLNMSVIRNQNNLNDFRLSGINKYIKFTKLRFLGSLSTLVVSYCSQTNITALDLRNLTQLHILDMSHNNVSIVEGSAFYGLESLGELNLSFNKITSIKPGVFKDNIKLQKLYISHNCIMFISYGIFRGLGSLSFVDISYNQIKSLKSERFYELKNLNYLIADYNQIDYVGLDEFSNTNLMYLSIGGNPLACDILVKMKELPKSFHITATELEHNREKVDGVSCNNAYNTYINRFDELNAEKSEKILQDIRNILMNSSNRFGIDYEIKNILSNLTKSQSAEISHNEHSFLSNITEILKTEKQMESLDHKQTNYLLSKIVNNTLPMVFHNNPILEKNPKDSNLNRDQTEEQLKKNNQKLENRVSKLENQLQQIFQIKNNSDTKESLYTITPKTEKLFLDKQTGAQISVFTETCVALILFIILCSVLFKMYKSRFFLRLRRSTSTREIAHSMDNSNL